MQEGGKIASLNSIHAKALGEIERAILSLGYPDDLLCRDYKYALVSDKDPAFPTRVIPLAAFAQYPPSYRTSCMGVIFSNGLSGEKNVVLHRDFGAPLIFEIESANVNRWHITAKGNAERHEQVPLSRIVSYFKSHRNEWDPSRIFRAKALNDGNEASQLDFFDLGLLPILESKVKEKLDSLLRNSLKVTRDTYIKSQKQNPNPKDLFRLVFRFVAAKILRDRGYDKSWPWNDPVRLLEQIEIYYNTSNEDLPSPKIKDRQTIEVAWESISNSLHFQNLSTDDLAFIYENTLITPETRKTFGIHSTPSNIAEYIVRKLPFESIEENKRYVFEPFSGHGIFLLSAMRRLRELLPSSMTCTKRHNYLKARLAGMEQDSFAVEVCRLSLMLADYPNRDDWKIIGEDVFTSSSLQPELIKADCILCNPPFEDFGRREMSVYSGLKSVHRPLDLILRILEHPPSLLGLVMPKIFLTGSAYKPVHKLLLQNYGSIELLELPDRIFNFSDAVTVLLMAWNKQILGKRSTIVYRTVTDIFRDTFLNNAEEPPAIKESFNLEEGVQDEISLYIPKLSQVWKYLSDYPKFSEFAKIHRGLEYNLPLKKNKNISFHNREKVFSDKPSKNFFPGLGTSKGTILQYHLIKHSYLRVEEEYMRGKAHNHLWDKPKIITNATRLSRGPWRLAAIYDRSGLYAYQTFHGIWPNNDADSLAILAILNSPISNAYLFSNEYDRQNKKTTILKIPFPRLDSNALQILSEKVRIFLSKTTQKAINDNIYYEEEARDALLQIDAEVLKLYDLPPILERELLNIFEGHQRPVPFEFSHYFEEGFSSYIPLHIYISREFNDARANRLLKKLKPIRDIVIHEALSDIEEKSE